MDTPFVSTDWLARHLADPNVVILDGSWWLPNANRNARAEYLAGHIPGALFFDIDAIADKSTPLPHMLLAPEAFAKTVGAMGIGDGMAIVAYDEAGLFSAPRLWWEFATMGVAIKLLEGGGPKWRAEGRPIETGEPPARRPATFTPHFQPELVRDFGQMQAAIAAGQQIADARPAGRFAGRDPEPRPGLPSGHMRGARNVPAIDVVANGTLKPAAELRLLFDRAGVDMSKPVITSCGSGITASTLRLALLSVGASDVAVYDGSWAEWGSQSGAEIVKDA